MGVHHDNFDLWNSRHNRWNAVNMGPNKGGNDCAHGTCVLDLERGVVDTMWDEPWQTDTCIGDWHYNREAKYKSPKTVIDLLVDIVSRNGNLLLNFPLPSSGMLDAQELQILDGITKWMAVNSDAIYSTRPWTTFGSGPSTDKAATDTTKGMGAHHNAGAFNERLRKDLIARDVRYTKKGNTLYAFSMGWPESEAVFPELASGRVAKIGRVTLLGHKGDLAWKQEPSGLRVTVPAEKPCDYAIVFRVDGV